MVVIWPEKRFVKTGRDTSLFRLMTILLWLYKRCVRLSQTFFSPSCKITLLNKNYCSLLPFKSNFDCKIFITRFPSSFAIFFFSLIIHFPTRHSKTSIREVKNRRIYLEWVGFSFFQRLQSFTEFNTKERNLNCILYSTLLQSLSVPVRTQMTTHIRHWGVEAWDLSGLSFGLTKKIGRLHCWVLNSAATWKLEDFPHRKIIKTVNFNDKITSVLWCRTQFCSSIAIF